MVLPLTVIFAVNGCTNVIYSTKNKKVMMLWIPINIPCILISDYDINIKNSFSEPWNPLGVMRNIYIS